MAGERAKRRGRGGRRVRSTTAPSLSTLLLLSCAASLLLLLLAAPLPADAKGLDVTLKARWEATSFVLEAAEFLVRR